MDMDVLTFLSDYQHPGLHVLGARRDNVATGLFASGRRIRRAECLDCYSLCDSYMGSQERKRMAAIAVG